MGKASYFRPDRRTVKRNDSSGLVIIALLKGTGKKNFLLFTGIDEQILQMPRARDDTETCERLRNAMEAFALTLKKRNGHSSSRSIVATLQDAGEHFLQPAGGRPHTLVCRIAFAAKLVV